MSFNKSLKIAIVCDWLTDFGGAERVVITLSRLFPEAPIYTSLYKKANFPQLTNRTVITSFIQKIPFLRNHHRLSLPLMPLAFENFNLDHYDLVISSCHCASKGIITKPQTLHICYCHNPLRYTWDDYHNYLAGYRLPKVLKNPIYRFLSKLRIWDRVAADRVDNFIANSELVKERIKKYYRHQAEVIYPPVDISRFSLKNKPGQYYLAIGRLIPYKRFDLLIEAANQFKFPLKIVGIGRELKRLKKLAGNTVEFLGWLSEEQIPDVYDNCKALLFPQVEDFGIAIVEAMACGKPVIAYAAGGALETVIDQTTGLLFKAQTVEALGQALKAFSKLTLDPQIIRKQAEKFSEEVFIEKIRKFIEKKTKIALAKSKYPV